MPELPHAHDDCVAKIFHLQIELLGSGKDFQNEIHRELLLHCFVIVCGLLLNDQSSTDCLVHC
jgi:hypothetical protein